MAKTFSLLIVSLLVCLPAVSAEPDRRFDDYGTVRWEDEKARLDNLAVYLKKSKDDVVYLLVVDSVGGCPGEASARAIRAKRYLTEHRGVPGNQVIWRREGYRHVITTTLVVVPKTTILEFPFLSILAPAGDGPMTRACRAKLSHIKKSRW